MITVSSTRSAENTDESSSDLPQAPCVDVSVRGEEVIGETEVTTLAKANTYVSQEILPTAVGVVFESQSKEQTFSITSDETDSIAMALQDTSVIEETEESKEKILNIDAEISTRISPDELSDDFNGAQVIEAEVLVDETESVEKTIVLESEFVEKNTGRVIEEDMITVSSTEVAQSTGELSSDLPHAACADESVRGEEVIGKSEVTTLAKANTNASQNVLPPAVGVVLESQSKEQTFSITSDETDAVHMTLKETTVIEETGENRDKILTVDAEISTRISPDELLDDFNGAQAIEAEILIREGESIDKTVLLEHTVLVESVPDDGGETTDSGFITTDFETTFESCDETTVREEIRIQEIQEQITDTVSITKHADIETRETWEASSGYGEEITTTKFKDTHENVISTPYTFRKRPATVVVNRTPPGEVPEWFETLEKLEKFIWQLESTSMKRRTTSKDRLTYRTASVDRKVLNTPTAMVSRSNPDIDTEWMWLDEIMTVYQWNQVTARSVSVDRSHHALCRLRALEGFGRSSVRGRPTAVVLKSGYNGTRCSSSEAQKRLVAGLGDRPATFLPHRTRSDSRYTPGHFSTDAEFQSRKQERDESLNRVAEFLSRSASRQGYSGDGGHRSRSLHRRVRGPTAVVTRTAPGSAADWEKMSTYEKLTKMRWSKNVHTSTTERRPYSLSASIERRTITAPTAVVVRSSRNLQEHYDSIDRLSRLTRFEWSSHSRTRRVSPRRISLSRSPTRRAYSMPTAVVHRVRPEYSYSTYSYRLASVERLTRMQFTTVRGAPAQTPKQMSFTTRSLDRRPANLPTAVITRTVAVKNNMERDSCVQSIFRMDDMIQRHRHISPSPQPRVIIKTHHRPRSLQKPTIICRSENPAQSGLIWPLFNKDRARSFAGAYTTISSVPSLSICTEGAYRSRSLSPRTSRRSPTQKSQGSPRYHLLLKPANLTDSGLFSMSDCTDSSLSLSRDSTFLSQSFEDSGTHIMSDVKSDEQQQLTSSNSVPRYHILLKQGGRTDNRSNNANQQSFEERSETKKHTTARIRSESGTGSNSPPDGQVPQTNDDITVKHRVMSWEASSDDVDHLSMLAESPSNDLTGEVDQATPSRAEDVAKRWNYRQ